MSSHNLIYKCIYIVTQPLKMGKYELKIHSNERTIQLTMTQWDGDITVPINKMYGL